MLTPQNRFQNLMPLRNLIFTNIQCLGVRFYLWNSVQFCWHWTALQLNMMTIPMNVVCHIKWTMLANVCVCVCDRIRLCQTIFSHIIILGLICMSRDFEKVMLYFCLSNNVLSMLNIHLVVFDLSTWFHFIFPACPIWYRMVGKLFRSSSLHRFTVLPFPLALLFTRLVSLYLVGWIHFCFIMMIFRFLIVFTTKSFDPFSFFSFSMHKINERQRKPVSVCAFFL